MRLLRVAGIVVMALPLMIIALGTLKLFIEDLMIAFKIRDMETVIMMSSLVTTVIGGMLVVFSYLF